MYFRGLNTTSIKTRIETCFQIGMMAAMITVLTPLPLKQGLKHKTAATMRKFTDVLTPLPLKQGLKPSAGVNPGIGLTGS